MAYERGWLVARWRYESGELGSQTALQAGFQGVLREATGRTHDGV